MKLPMKLTNKYMANWPYTLTKFQSLMREYQPTVTQRQQLQAVTEPSSRQQSSGNAERQQLKSCLMCGECHTLFGCQRFKSLSVDERISFVKQNKLCFNCLLPNHQSSSCSLTRRCTVNGCGKRHTKFLHVINREAPAKQQAQSMSRNSGANC